MKYLNVEDYISQLPDERKKVITELRKSVLKNIPEGFTETINYDMIGYVIPHSIYPSGYHVDPSLPLPFINIASQKHHVALYHMGIYTNTKLLKWFQTEYQKMCRYKLDMGKSCIRFKHFSDIPYDLIGELTTKINPQQWIEIYESSIKHN